MNLLQIIAYLFEHYPLKEINFELKEKKIVTELTQAGFQIDKIYQALTWLMELYELKRNEQALLLPSLTSLRLFSTPECWRIDAECRGYLLYLERIGILNALTREQVIDRLLRLDSDLITIFEIKVVTLIVLSVHANQEAALKVMAKLFLEESLQNGVH